MKNKVSIIKGKKPEEMVKKAVDKIGGIENFIGTDEKVFIKPNLGTLKTSEEGATTDPRVVMGVIDLIQQHTNDISIVESDSAACDAEIIWSHCGYDELAKKKNVKLINLTNEPSLTYMGYRLPKILFTDHTLINIPKIKTNDLTVITCSLKNLFGLMPTRHRAKYHKTIDKVITDLNKAFNSTLVVVDGLICMEGDGPISGDPVKLNLVIAGNNPVAVDSVMCNIIGVDPTNINHIKKAANADLGHMNINSINLYGEKIKDVKRNFKLPSTIPIERKVKYLMLEHSEKLILKQGVGLLRWLHRRKFS